MQNVLMANKDRKPVDRHKPSRMVRIKGALAVQLDKLVQQNATDMTEEVNRAVREMLAREGLWPASAR